MLREPRVNRSQSPPSNSIMQLESCLGDLRFAWRSAVRRPAFTLLLVSTLALGIGVNSAVFTLLDAVLLRSLPYRDPARLVFVWQTLPEHNILELEPTAFDYDAWHAVRSFSAIGLVANGAFTLSGDENPERIRGPTGRSPSLRPASSPLVWELAGRTSSQSSFQQSRHPRRMQHGFKDGS